MSTLRTFLLATVSLSLTACTAAGSVRTLLPLGSLGSDAPTQPSAANARAGEGEYGTLRLAIAWPQRDLPGFRVAAIPTSTNALVVRVTQGTATLSLQTLQRPDGGAVTPLSLRIPRGNNYAVDVRAYRESTPSSDSVPIAQGTAAGINVVNSAVSSVNLTLAATFAPAISALSANLGQVGSVVTLSGLNLAPVGDVPPVVTFNGATSSLVVPLSSTSLAVTVPPGATVGQVVVSNDGIRSTSSALYWVGPLGLSTSAPKASWDPSPAGQRVVLSGQTLAFQAVPTWALAAGATESSYGTAPAVSWALDDPAAGTLSPSGLYTAGTIYATGSVTASLGGRVSAEIVAAAETLHLALSPSAIVLGPWGAASASFAFSATLSDGTSPLLSPTFTSSDPATLSINAMGQAFPAASAFGVVSVSAAMLGAVVTSTVTVSNALVSTIAGGQYGPGGGPAAMAQFEYPAGLAFDAIGNLFIIDSGNSAVRKLDVGSSVSTVGQYAGANQVQPCGIAVDGAGTVYLANAAIPSIVTMTPEGVTGILAGSAGVLRNPSGVVVAPNGDVLVADQGHNQIAKFSQGVYSVLAGGTQGSADGTGTAAQFYGPTAIALEASGDLVVADAFNARIRKVSPSGQVTTLAGSTSGHADGSGLQARFTKPTGIAVDRQGNVFVSDALGTSCLIRLVTPGGRVSTLAGGGYAATDGLGTTAGFQNTFGLAADAAGALYATDASPQEIRKIVRVP